MSKSKKRKPAGNFGGRGRRPEQSEIDQMAERGYVLPAAAASMVGVATQTVYGWIRRGVLKTPPGDERPPTFANAAKNVFVLEAAVLTLRQLPPFAEEAK